MHLIDDRGRLLGKVNLIDAIVGVVALGLVPLVYGAFLLFRVPVPKVTSITPTQVFEHQTATLQVAGVDLRPFMRARFGLIESGGLLVLSPTVAEIKLPDLAAGTYDLVLYDEGQELVTRPGALTVVPLPPPPPPPSLQIDVQAVGAFIGLQSGDTASIAVGSRFEPRTAEAAVAPGGITARNRGRSIAEVLNARAPEPDTQRVRMGANALATVPLPGQWRVPAIIRLSCGVVNGECKVGDTVVAADAIISLPLPVHPRKDETGSRGRRDVRFLIDEVRSVGARPQFPLPVDVQALGAFVGLVEDELQVVRVGAKFDSPTDAAFGTPSSAGRPRDPGAQGPIAEVLAVRSPLADTQRVKGADGRIFATPARREVRVPAIVRLSCRLVNEDCRVGDTVVVKNALIAMALPRAESRRQPRLRAVTFRVDELRPADAPVAFPLVRAAVATARVRFIAGPEVADLMKAGDVDIGGATAVTDADRAVLTEVGSERQTMSALATMESPVRRGLQLEQPVIAFTGTVRVPVVFLPSGWSYKDRTVKVGASFAFESASGVMVGYVLDMKLDQETERLPQ